MARANSASAALKRAPRADVEALFSEAMSDPRIVLAAALPDRPELPYANLPPTGR
jgi:hypothetical protein